ncbi:MAG: hypothetical protein Q9M40_02370 [Sulfurimonas sp.]|nr:hypothetical protein [Sulfurimonas sp.]
MAPQKREQLSLRQGQGFIEKPTDLNLNSEEKFRLSKYKTSFFEPYILVSIEIIDGTNTSNIIFEYDIKNKKGSNFVYEI